MPELHYGIDISEWQEGLEIAAEGPEFVIIRYADGDYHDICCSDFITQCVRNNIPYGLYYFLRAKDEAGARAEARDILKYIESLQNKPTMGIWADVEDLEHWEHASNAVEPAKAFLSEIEKAGYYAGCYCNYSFYNELYPALEKYDCWIADWSGIDYDSPGTMQQYGTSGGTLDRDVSFVPLSTYDLKSGGAAVPGEGLEVEKETSKLIKEIKDKLTKLEGLLK